MSFDHLLPSSDTAKKCGRVAVLMGGTSAEREVSLTSGSFVLQALQAAGVDAFKVDLGENKLQQLIDLRADRVFNILHGRGGEDGEIQAILEILKIPYTGSGVKASAVTMDKLMTKRLLQGCGLNTPDFMEIKSVLDCEKVLQTLSLPLIVKPVNEGSSIGMSRVSEADQLIPAFAKAAEYGDVMVEQWVTGSEYTVSWLDHTILPFCKIETPHDFYDYDAKYQASDTSYLFPSGLNDAQQKQLEKLTLDTIDICNLRHWGRADFMMTHEGEFQIIDVNTVPGMTDHSLVPMAAREAGLNFQQLVLKILELTLEKEAENV